MRLARRYTDQQRHTAAKVLHELRITWPGTETLFDIVDQLAYELGLWRFPDEDDRDFRLPS